MDISQKKNTITIILKKVDMISGKWKPEKKSGIGEWTTKITQPEKQKENKITYLVSDIPKSFILMNDGSVYVVELSSQILKKRFEII